MDEFSAACKCIELQLPKRKIISIQVSVFPRKDIQNIQQFGIEV